jgi:hypothetical protein
MLIGALLVAGTLGSNIARPAAAHNGLVASAGTISVGGSVTLTQTLDAPATGTVTSMTVVLPDSVTTCAINSGGAVPFQVVYPSNNWHKVSGPGKCDTQQTGPYVASDIVAVGVNSFSFNAPFTVSFFVLPESPIGVAALTGSSLAALGAFIGLRKLKSSSA